MAERMTAGQEAVHDGAIGLNPYAPPSDTGEALGLPPSQLTLTIGFGPSFFLKDGKDRFGIADQKPARTGGPAEVPQRDDGPGPVRRRHRRPGLRQRPSGGCARHPQPGPGRASARWRCATPSWDSAAPRRPPASSPLRETCSGSRTEPTTSRPRTPARSNDQVWVANGDGPDWLTGGSYLISRRIRMRIESWDRTTLLEQERVIGRQKGSGAPNGQTQEFQELNFDLVDNKNDPADRRRRPRAACLSSAPGRHPRSCAAATTSPTAPTASATWTPGCSSSRSCVTRRPSSSRCRPSCPAATR